MEKIKLSAKLRSVTGKKVKNLRKQNLLPAVLYGQGDSAQNVQINLDEFKKTYKKAGTSTLIDLTIDDKNPIKVLLNEPQYEPVTGSPLHIDLYKIRMDKKITTEIPLNFIGDSPAVKELEGNLIKSKDALEIECLPGDLISQIDVDISNLKTFNDVISIKDLKIPETIKVLSDLDETVASVTPPRSEEELKSMEEEAAADTEKAQVEKMEAEAQAQKAEKDAAKEDASKVEKKPAEQKPTKEGKEE